MVINDDVADAVVMATTAVESIHREARQKWAPGSNRSSTASRLQTVYHTARQACVRAENAFFNPTLLALLYFPTDEMYAVFVPYGVPLVMLALSTVVKHRKHVALDEAACVPAVDTASKKNA